MRLPYFSAEKLSEVTKTLLAVLLLFSCNIVGFVSTIPSELRVLLDAHFVFSRSIEVTYAAVLASLISKVVVDLAVGLSPSLLLNLRRRYLHLWRTKPIKILRCVNLYLQRRQLQVGVFVWVATYSIVLFGIFFHWLLISIMIASATSFFALFSKRIPELDKRTAAFDVRLVSSLALGFGVAFVLIGKFSAMSHLTNYVELRSADQTISGALITATSNGVMIVKEYDWQLSMARGDYSMVFVPMSEFDYVWTRPRVYEVFSGV